MYSIKQVATRLNCNPNAIRFYERKGLVNLYSDENGSTQSYGWW